MEALIVGMAEVTPAIRDGLADAGCTTIASASFEAAVAARPDVVLVEVAALGALGTIEQLIADHADLPIVALCDESELDALVAGAAECVIKPVRRNELAYRVRRALQTRVARLAIVERERKKSDRIAALQREKHDLERLVCVDALTGIANRRHGLALLEAEWRRSTREHLPLGLVMIDLDCYHAYNEQYGHLGGDRCLQQVADAMVRCLRRPSDYLGRYGGEEFMAVLPNTDAAGARLVGERLRAAIEALAIPHAASVCARVVTITVGFASLRATADLTVDRLIAAADAALLRAKASGRNRVHGDAPVVRASRLPASAWTRFAPVFADPWFADRIPAFLATARIGARRIADCIARGDHARAAALTHDLHDAAHDLGMPAIERLISDVEQALELGPRLDQAAAAIDEVLQYITHVQVIYRRTAEPEPSGVVVRLD